MSQNFLSPQLSTITVGSAASGASITFPTVDVTGYSTIKITAFVCNVAPVDYTLDLLWTMDQPPQGADLIDKRTTSMNELVTYTIAVRARYFSFTLEMPVTGVASDYEVNTFLGLSSGNVMIENVGSGVEIFNPNALEMRTLVSGNGTIGLVQSDTEIDLATASNVNFAYQDVTTGGTTITISTLGVYVPADLVYAEDSNVPADWSHPADGEMQYDGIKTESFMISYSISAAIAGGGSTSAVRAKFECHDTVSWVDVVGSTSENQLVVGDLRNFGTRARCLLMTGYKLRVSILNRDNTSDVVIQILSTAFG